MSDQVDIAALNDFTEERLSAFRSKVHQSLTPVGSCYYCEEDLPPGRIFCDAQCRDDYEREQRLRRMHGCSNSA